MNRCGWVHKSGTVAGIAFSIVVGGEGLPNALKGLSNGTKGAIGEGLSIAENTLTGSTRLPVLGRIPGTRAIPDSAWRSLIGQIYYVESKFGTSHLTAAQRLAANALGDAYQVEQWTYPFFGRIGGYLGAGYGGVGAMSGRSCGCN